MVTGLTAARGKRNAWNGNRKCHLIAKQGFIPYQPSPERKDCSGRGEDSCGTCGIGETTQERKRRGWLTARPAESETPGTEIANPI